jgi:NAD-dependent dihydropyrimidine dehydrogenase PreA subunit
VALRKIVYIDEEKCDGCGICIPSCAEGALQVIDGKAKLLGEKLCDGLGACLGECPQDAITVEAREADDFDEEAVKVHLGKQGAGQATEQAESTPTPIFGAGGGCPGARVLQFDRSTDRVSSASEVPVQKTQLRQWPVQMHLLPPTAPFLEGADVLLAADCSAFALGNFHDKHLKGRALAIACPKLDQGQEMYLAKLITMIDEARINTLNVMTMEVPCCSGLVGLAKEAASRASRKVPVRQTVVGVRGDILTDEWV